MFIEFISERKDVVDFSKCIEDVLGGVHPLTGE